MRDAFVYELLVAFCGFVLGVLVTLLAGTWLDDRPRWDEDTLEGSLEGSLEHPLEGVRPVTGPYDWERDREV